MSVGQRFTVRIRRELGEVRPEAEQLEGRVFVFRRGWTIDAEDREEYAGEAAMIAYDPTYPKDAPGWIASGDLEPFAG
jgi:hypothetical protein